MRGGVPLVLISIAAGQLGLTQASSSEQSWSTSPGSDARAPNMKVAFAQIVPQFSLETTRADRGECSLN